MGGFSFVTPVTGLSRLNTGKEDDDDDDDDGDSIFIIVIDSRRSRGSSVSIVSDYGLDDRAIGVRSPAGAKDISSKLCVQTGSGAHQASCTMGTGGPFPGGKSAAGA
jgi:hypothetical protein